MSDFPGEMMNAILVAPAASIRSTRCSLTARGRSTPPSRRLPTGSSSFENASGWIRVPAPAAGMIPHTIVAPHNAFELGGAARRGVFGQRALARRARQRLQFAVGSIERRNRVGGGMRDENLVAGLEERVEPLP